MVDKIEEYLDYKADINLAYKYAECPQWKRPEEVRRQQKSSLALR